MVGIGDPSDAVLQGRQAPRDPTVWVETVLRRQEMPEDEVRVVLTSADRTLVRRHLELHLERLEERLIAQRRTVAAAERLLSGRFVGTTTGQRDPRDARMKAGWSTLPFDGDGK
jgi:hypothetical protein